LQPNLAIARFASVLSFFLAFLDFPLHASDKVIVRLNIQQEINMTAL